MDNRKTGELIKTLRIEKGMKQKDLADRLFVSVAAVSKWENGKGFPDVSVLSDLCKALDVSIEEIVKGERNGMEKKQVSITDEIIEIAGKQEKKHKKQIKALCFCLIIAVIIGLFAAMSSSLHSRKTYVGYKAGSFDTCNMYIENSGNVPSLYYKGKQFKQIEEHYYEIDGKEYLFISIESTAWNECFGSSGTGQYAFWTFNEGVLGNTDVYDPERFQGVWLYEGSIIDLYSQYPNITVSTKGLLESLLKLSTYIPYRTELS